MEAKKLKNRHGPEYHVRAAIIKMLEGYGWIVKIVHGSMYQSGLPDLYCTHKKYGPRWIEVKLPNMVGSRWTAEQYKTFPILSDNGTPIWVLVAATETEYKKLFMPENWLEYFLLKN
jgi:hypothetical protein